MLTIERRPGSSILIGRNIRVQVRWIKHRRAVRLGIEAPRHIPVVREELAEADWPGQGEASHPAFRVTLVEDDVDHADFIQTALGEHGVTEIIRYANGESAWHSLATHGDQAERRPHLILLDLGLPGMSGRELLERIRGHAELKRVPVVVLSCHDTDDEVSHCLDAGANAFVAKTESSDGLEESIGRIIQFWMATRAVA
jgi:carbon storage regulator CsrA